MAGHTVSAWQFLLFDSRPWLKSGATFILSPTRQTLFPSNDQEANWRSLSWLLEMCWLKQEAKAVWVTVNFATSTRASGIGIGISWIETQNSALKLENKSKSSGKWLSGVALFAPTQTWKIVAQPAVWIKWARRCVQIELVVALVSLLPELLQRVIHFLFNSIDNLACACCSLRPKG